VSVKLQRIGGSLGIALSDDNQITAVHAGGAGAIAGLKVGDVVNEVDGKSVHLASFGSLLPKEKDAVITMRVRRFVETEEKAPKAGEREGERAAKKDH
jgi:C-terminal processing protease CtpA/Prc